MLINYTFVDQRRNSIITCMKKTMLLRGMKRGMDLMKRYFVSSGLKVLKLKRKP